MATYLDLEALRKVVDDAQKAFEMAKANAEQEGAAAKAPISAAKTSPSRARARKLRISHKCMQASLRGPHRYIVEQPPRKEPGVQYACLPVRHTAT